MVLLIVIFLVGTVFWLSYWALIRPVLLDCIELELASIRSTVEWAIIDGLPDSQSEAAQRLADGLKRAACARYISFSAAIAAMFFRRAEINASVIKDRQVFDSAPTWIREIRYQDTRLSLKAALLNSPAWWIPLPSILFGALLSKKVADWWYAAESAAVKLRSEQPKHA